MQSKSLQPKNGQFFVIDLPDETATLLLGKKLASFLRPNDVLTLSGPLGAGKTTLARSIIQVLMGKDDPVPSPTFTLAQHYETPRGMIWHFDLYRLRQSDEIPELGWEDALSDGIVIVEWPERAARYMPGGALQCRIAPSGDHGRVATFTGTAEWHSRLAELWKNVTT